MTVWNVAVWLDIHRWRTFGADRRDAPPYPENRGLYRHYKKAHGPIVNLRKRRAVAVRGSIHNYICRK